MSWDRIEGNWEQFKVKVQRQWGKLTEDEVTVIDVITGERMDVSGHRQERRDKQSAIQADIDIWRSRRLTKRRNEISALRD